MPREYPTAPVVGLGAVVWRDDKVLMIKRGRPPRAGIWSLPGGGQDLGETVEQGIRRELREETGVEVELLGLVAVIDSVQRDAEGRVLYHYTIVDYAARWASGEVVAGDDAADAAWFSLEELAGLHLWEETLRVIEQSRRFLNGKG
ncbi:NUDIX hydrolase [Ferrovibrio sp.]|uniref:NUDIX hydrolase n=1 Tax=Ferrovibrio sp. TaxID=1917215 RepID=UPI001B6B2BEE|nr:NUDIX hydrolase [Ferrovibrio sp.]MBP7063590.1 NUDIX hydrolase [Ferrovibrio sp.]